MIKYELNKELNKRAKELLKDQQILKYKQTLVQLLRLNNKTVNIIIK